MLHDRDVIEQFRQAMADHGIVVTEEIVPDGKFHRVHVEGDKRRVRNGWYCLHLDGRPAGAFGCNKRYGNEQKFTWTAKATTPLSPEERRAFRDRMAKQAAEREAEHKRLREAAAAHARYLWDQAQDCTEHPYLARKGVKAHGLRVGVWEKLDRENGEVHVISKQALLIPIRDAKKNIHSLQAIFTSKCMGDRDKDFVTDGAKAGLFYSFGKPQAVDIGGEQRPVIMIGEGYATLASAHECTGHAAIVAFDAGNLMAVARVLRERFPNAVLLLLADNDQWTKQPIDNPGLTKAREAAAAVGGLVAFPDFAASEGKMGREGKTTGPTDFNDLHQLRGADAVRQVIEAALNPPTHPDPGPGEDVPPWEGEPEFPEELAAPLPAPVGGEDDDGRPEANGYFAILGYNRETYYIFSHGKRQILEYSASKMSELGLIQLAPLNWWELNFPGERTKIDTKAAAEFIMRTADRRGIYDPSKVRGRGAWIDDGRFVFHHGDYLTVNGESTDVSKIKSRYVYELDRSLPPPATTPMTCEEGERLLGLSEMFRWKSPSSAALLAGWVALAPVCGALRWRPHVWLSGGAGSGKTTVLNDYVHHLLGGLDLYAQGSSSEAGIRQTLRADALPVLFDESESNEEGDARRIQNVLGLIRQASTESEAQTLKGTAGGDSMRFHIRSMFCLASIQVALKQQADIERLTVLTLRSKHGEEDAAGGWERLKNALYEVRRDIDLPARLLRRVINLLPVTLRNIHVFTSAAARHFGNQRDGDQFGTLLAGAWSLISDEEATVRQAEALINRYDWSDIRDQGDTDESTRALMSLMEAHVRIKGGAELTVYELVRAASGVETGITDINEMTADAILQRYGMRVRGDWLLMSNNSNELRRLMEGSTFEADYRGVLLRCQGADKNENKPERFNGVQTKCIRLPLQSIVRGDREEPAF